MSKYKYQTGRSLLIRRIVKAYREEKYTDALDMLDDALTKAEQRGIERARKVVEAAEVRNQHHQDLKLDLLDALTEARTETEGGK